MKVFGKEYKRAGGQMTLTNEQVENIKSEFNQWKDKMYANKTLSE